jgi:hypothetical protein
MRISPAIRIPLLSWSVLLCCTFQVFPQEEDTSRTAILKKSADTLVKEDSVKSLPQITMPRYRMAPIKQQKFRLEVSNRTRAGDIKYEDPTAKLNDDVRDEIKIFPRPPLSLEAGKIPVDEPLPIREYVLPTREEYEVLKILWLKENVMDTTIYSCIDTSVNLTMSLLNDILARMTGKRLVSREQVSPRLEFNAFGVPIEMSPKNIRNRVYAYHSLVDREKLQHFIDAAHYEVSQDSGVLKQKRLKSAQKDSTLLNDLRIRSLMDH